MHGTQATGALTIRESRAEDGAELDALAQRDSAKVPEGRLLIGEVDGAVRAAVAVESGATIADPFHRTRDLVALLHARAHQVRIAGRKPMRVALRRAGQEEGWRSTGRREAAASSSLRTGVV